MKGHYTKRSCKCEDKENCTCGSTWSFVIDVGRNPKTGRRKQGSGSGFKTKEEAQLAAATLVNEVNQGTFIKESNILFKDWADEWLSYYIERNAPKPGTIRIRQHGINKLLQYFAHLKLKNITEEMYQKVLNDLKDQQKLARSTIESIHTVGKMIFKMAVNKRMLKVNPTLDAYIKKDQKVIIESDEEELPNFFEKEELDLFLDTVKNEGLYMDYLIFLLLSYTGMRIGELIALKWKDIDFNKKIIKITKTYYNPNNNSVQYKIGPPKTEKSRRKIIVDEIVIDAFKKHMEEQKQKIAHFGNSYTDKDYVFANFNRHPGFPITMKLINDRMKRLLKRAGLNTELSSHSLRHTHTSLLAQADVDLEEIKDRLGHQDDEVTRKIYLHVTNVMKKEASDKFSKLMRGL